MNLCEMNPFVRYIEKRNSFAVYKKFVLAYDHRVFYVRNGRINADVSGMLFEINSNEMLIIPPAVKYKLTFGKDVLFTVINFDVVTENVISCALEPKTEDEFDYSKILSSVTCPEFPCVFSCDENANQLISEIETVFISNSTFKNAIISSLLKLFIIKGKSYASSVVCPPLVKNIMSFVAENYMHDISNRMLGELFSYHPNYINRIFKENTGHSLHRYILNVRLEQATILIRESSMGLSEIAQRCGFCTQSYFTKKFVEKYNITPHKFKNKKYL